MKTKQGILLVLSLFLVAVSLFGQDTLTVVPGTVTVDGVRGTGEYTYSTSQNNMELWLRRLDDNRLAFFYQVKTTGRIALGFGSVRMDSAHILIGYQAAVTVADEQTGAGNTHSRATTTVLQTSLMREVDGYTIWEGIIDGSRFLAGPNLQMIMAYGRADNLTTRHQARGSLTVTLR